MEENNKTFIVKDECIKSVIRVFKKIYTEKKESFDKRGITPENMEKILEVFSGKNATLVECCIAAIASTLPAENLERLMEALRFVLGAKIIRTIKEKMKNSKS